ncbi:uncharacterized protein K452DRAFT_316235 [Aplosporella prunicola CBS 121167]|uniref:trimethyllysine dioxygenase n=1 Tax=Aplosporella prunicola CBS 121167 TaxID=1176127 RepID=A0A6A6BM54_9PEZI|nr:uncharacterized protein K452DRAFT_316235 [Aplosporella prunicola CBS 121167]KAF2145126.1 hypothetical protein K452DRAFT_316235 [Aplosporella prunicola CBS 121167]
MSSFQILRHRKTAFATVLRPFVDGRFVSPTSRGSGCLRYKSSATSDQRSLEYLDEKTVEVARKVFVTRSPRTYINVPPHIKFPARPVVEPNAIKVCIDGTPGYPLSRIPPILLRDHCKCPECVHPVTKQRLLDTFALPANLSIESCVDEGKSVRVNFSDGHVSEYSYNALTRLNYRSHRTHDREGEYRPTLWGSSIADSPPTISYKDVMQRPKGLKSWIHLLRRFGFAYVDGCPVTPEATQELLEKIAFIRNTHYGGFWDFTSDLASKDTAYTDIALDAHTDNTYFSDPAGLQMFHLLSHTEGEGGESILVDGFKAADQLYNEDRTAFAVLCTVPVNSHASGNEGVRIQPYKPLPVFMRHGRRLVQVRWNNSDRAGIDCSFQVAELWYEAARKWNDILKRPENEYRAQLVPGRALIFDNWRVLHGRTAFTGKRRMCGGYINRDDYMSRYRSEYKIAEDPI